MILLDSSFLVAFFHEKDKHHEEAKRKMREYEKEKKSFMITEHVLGETASVLLYYAGLKQAKEFIEHCKENLFIQGWSSDDREATIGIFENQKHELSYIDASLVYLSKFIQVPIATFDKNIIKELGRK